MQVRPNGLTRRQLRGAAAVLAALSAARASADVTSPSWPAGSWDVDYLPDEGGPFQRPFKGLWTFGADGVLLVSDQPPVRLRAPDGSRPLFGLGHGAWSPGSDDLGFLFRQSAAPLSIPSDILIAITVRGRISPGIPDGGLVRSWSGRFSAVALDPEGRPAGKGDGALSAKRIEVG